VRAVLTGGEPRLRVPEREQRGAVFSSYLGLGFEHILSGVDHLLFVLGLILLVSGMRALVATVTAFTLGHSVTLSAAALGFVHFPTRWAETLIAFSIALLANELVRGEREAPSPMRRRPWAMSASFGLLHGFGFAGALAEVGLPGDEIPLALFAFNVGIELGQLCFVVAVVALRGAFGRWLALVPARFAPLPAYAIGTLAAYWCFQRALGA
jgi:hydrogenase/urease accessory protein HupE